MDYAEQAKRLGGPMALLKFYLSRSAGESTLSLLTCGRSC